MITYTSTAYLQALKASDAQVMISNTTRRKLSIFALFQRG